MVACQQSEGNSVISSDSSSQRDVVNVESVSLNQESVNLYVGDDYTLTATVLPQNATNKNVEWSSSNEGILQVFDGVVTALGTGDAYVTVTTQDGNKTARCDFTISQKVDDEPVEIENGLLEAMEEKEYQSEDGTKNLKYRMYTPSSYNESNEYGLLVYFHDEEGKGNDNASQLQNHNKTIYLEKVISKASYKDKFFIIAPQCPIGESFSNVTDGKIDATESNMMSLVSELIMNMCDTYSINLAKVLATGVGSGATAVFDAINRNVGLFAGAVVIGGTANVEDYENYALTSIWSFSSSNPLTIDNEYLY
jgi:predicted peptidase